MSVPSTLQKTHDGCGGTVVFRPATKRRALLAGEEVVLQSACRSCGETLRIHWSLPGTVDWASTPDSGVVERDVPVVERPADLAARRAERARRAARRAEREQAIELPLAAGAETQWFDPDQYPALARAHQSAIETFDEIEAELRDEEAASAAPAWSWRSHDRAAAPEVTEDAIEDRIQELLGQEPTRIKRGFGATPATASPEAISEIDAFLGQFSERVARARTKLADVQDNLSSVVAEPELRTPSLRRPESSLPVVEETASIREESLEAPTAPAAVDTPAIPDASELGTTDGASDGSLAAPSYPATAADLVAEHFAQQELIAVEKTAAVALDDMLVDEIDVVEPILAIPAPGDDADELVDEGLIDAEVQTHVPDIEPEGHVEPEDHVSAQDEAVVEPIVEAEAAPAPSIESSPVRAIEIPAGLVTVSHAAPPTPPVSTEPGAVAAPAAALPRVELAPPAPVPVAAYPTPLHERVQLMSTDPDVFGARPVAAPELVSEVWGDAEVTSDAVGDTDLQPVDATPAFAFDEATDVHEGSFAALVATSHDGGFDWADETPEESAAAAPVDAAPAKRVKRAKPPKPSKSAKRTAKQRAAGNAKARAKSRAKARKSRTNIDRASAARPVQNAASTSTFASVEHGAGTAAGTAARAATSRVSMGLPEVAIVVLLALVAGIAFMKLINTDVSLPSAKDTGAASTQAEATTTDDENGKLVAGTDATDATASDIDGASGEVPAAQVLPPTSETATTQDPAAAADTAVNAASPGSSPQSTSADA